MLSVPTNLNDKMKASFMDILVRHFRSPGVHMISQTILSLYSYNATSGVVVDIGDRIEVLPITDGNLTYICCPGTVLDFPSLATSDSVSFLICCTLTFCECRLWAVAIMTSCEWHHRSNDAMMVCWLLSGYVVEGGVERQPYGGQKITDSLNASLTEQRYRFFTDVEFQIVRLTMEKVASASTVFF